MSLVTAMNLLSVLSKQNTVNQVVELLFKVTEEINESLKLCELHDTAGASEISEYLEKTFLPLVIKMPYKELERHLVKTHIASLYLQATARSLGGELDQNVESKQLTKIRECYAVVENMRAILLNVIFQRFVAYDDSFSTVASLKDIKNIIQPIEREYEDFDLVLSGSTQKNIIKICSMNINEVADASRCITLTEMVSIDRLREAVYRFYQDKDKRNTFQHKLFNHLVDNLDHIVKEQIALDPQAIEKSLYHQTLLQILRCIEDMIIETEWKVGFMGGVEICNTRGKVLNTVPHGMAKILDLINETQADCNEASRDQFNQMIEAFTKISNQIALSANQPPAFSFFSMGKRDPQTQAHYDELNQGISMTSASLSRYLF